MTTVTASPWLDASFLEAKHRAGLDYESYLATDPVKAARWRPYEQQVTLTDDQRTLIAGFVRPIKVLVVSGIWCGDCAVQCPMLVNISQAATGPLSAPLRSQLRQRT